MKIPRTAHFAIITEDKQYVYHEANQRSKDCPGHGYPAYTETIESIKYEAFVNKEAWEARIKVLVDKKQPFHAIKALPAAVTTSVSIAIEVPDGA